MQWQPLEIVGGAYSDETKAWSVQDCVNFLPTPAEQSGTRSKSILRCAPGLELAGSVDEASCRGLHAALDTLYGVFGANLYRINPDTTITKLAAIPGVGRVAMANNQIALGAEVVIANSYGSTYVWNTRTETLTHVTSTDFPGMLHVAFMDGYIMGVDPSKHYVLHSKIADATSYSGLDVFQAESSPDLIEGIAVVHDQLWVFGTHSTQPFSNRGSSGFVSVSGAMQRVGCANGDTVAEVGGTVAWLADDGSIRIANGYQAQRVSTVPIEQAIAKYDTRDAFGLGWHDRGHAVYYLTVGDKTFGYDLAVGQWHRRESYEIGKWRVNNLAKCYGKWFAGDYTNGKLYNLDWDTQHENGAVLERRRTMGVIANSGNRIIVNGLRLDVATGGRQPPQIGASGFLTSAGCGHTVSYQYQATGGTPPYTFAIVSGALPTGLTMSQSGKVTGEIADGGDYQWTVEVTDAFGQQAQIIEDRTGDKGFYAHLTSQIYPIFVQDDADSPLVTGGSVQNLRFWYPPVEETLVTGGSVQALTMTKTVTYGTYDHPQDDADSPVVTGGSVTDLTVTVVASYGTYDHAQDDTDSPVVTGGSVQALSMAVVAGYQTYDWLQDDDDSPIVTGGSVQSLTMTTV